jgi:hypothetical protein
MEKLRFCSAIGRQTIQAEADRQEIRGAISKLVDIVENKRDFTQQVAKLAITSEQKLTQLESGV